MAKPNLFLGCKSSNALLQTDSGYTDNGSTYTLLAKTDRIALAGVGGESAFYALFIPVEHDVGCTIRVTAIIDGVAKPSQDFVLPVPSARHVALLDVPLLERFPSSIPNYATQATFAPRGTWLQVQVETVGAATGYVCPQGVEIEHETLRERLTDGVNK